MKQQTLDLVNKLKENGEDNEFYPTTDEIIQEIYSDLRKDVHTSHTFDILDIGCGNCKLKDYIDKNLKIAQEHNKKASYDQRIKEIYSNYYGIEKSSILINTLLDKDVYLLGTDFNQCTLLDKKVNIIFCNPPYSDFENWTNRIIKEGNFEKAYLVIPKRWLENKDIKINLEKTNSEAEILGSFDFLNAERQARAYVDVVKITKKIKYNDKTPFDLWFDETFKIEDQESQNSFDEYKKSEEKENVIRNEIVCADNKIQMLVDLYNNEMSRLFTSFKAVCQLDYETMKDINININNVKESLKKRIEGLKTISWRRVFGCLDEITNKLTSKSRSKMINEFERKLEKIDFNEDNIRMVLIWVIKNANKYYDKQLIDFYKSLSGSDNVIPYKSNQKTFQKDDWRWNKSEQTHYTLDYRIVCSYVFSAKVDYNNKFCDYNRRENEYVIKDFMVIARNLGFDAVRFGEAFGFGEKQYCYMKDDKVLFEYKIYKNRNTHIKLNIEFARAMNVEVSRLLGWIRCKEDIAKEFSPEMAKGAEKYFKSNHKVLENSKLLLLTN